MKSDRKPCGCLRSTECPHKNPADGSIIANPTGFSGPEVKFDALNHPQVNITTVSQPMRDFGTGATRAPVEGRIDGEAYLSPLVLERFSEYMLKHQVTVTGERRQGDNWQKGIPKDVYMKGLWRHFLHLWQRHRGWKPKDHLAAADIEEDLCALLFGIQGYLHELLKDKYK